MDTALVGLLLELVGVAIIWRYGWPQPQLEGGVSSGLEDGTPYGPVGQTVADYKREVEERRAEYTRKSSNGFLILVLGFVLQILSHW